MTDNLTKAQAKTFAQLRWKMIWDDTNWRQARHEVEATIAANTEEVTLPAEVETVIMARIDGNREIFPTTDLVAMSSDPSGIGSPGMTLAFSNYAKDSAGNARVRLHRPLDQARTILFVCKRKCVELVNDSDTPLISGIDQCLIAFVMGDLYEWVRQMGKAQLKYQEGIGLLGKMQEIETQQSGRIVRIIPMDGGEYDFNGSMNTGWSKS
jgi:hypothetical protein